MRLLLIRILLLSLGFGVFKPAAAGQQVNIYRAQALVKSQSEVERAAAARATFGELLVRVSGQRSALDNPVVSAAIPNAQNYLFGFSYRSTSEKLVEGARSFTALALQLDYEPQAIAQLLRDAQLPLWPAQRPTLLVWLVFKDQRGLHVVPELMDLQAMESFAAYRGVPLLFPAQDIEDSVAIHAEDLWRLDQEKIKAASARYNADAILVGRYTPSSMGPIPSASAIVESHLVANSVNVAADLSLPVEGPWLGDWLLLQGDTHITFADETPEVKGLFSSALDQAADHFANQYALVPTGQGAQQLVLRIGNITNFAAFKQVQAYLEELALVQRMEVLTVNPEAIVVRLTTDADIRLVTNTLALGRRLALVQTESASGPLPDPVLTAPTAPPGAMDGIDAEAIADLERAMANEQFALDEGAGATQVSTGTLQDPLLYLWQQ